WEAFAAADVQNVRIGWRHDDPANRAGWLIVEDRLPRPAGVRRLPDTAVHHPDIKGVRLAGVTGCCLRPPGAMRADAAPTHLREQTGIYARSLLRGQRCGHGAAQDH